MPINSWTINLILGIIMSVMVGGGIYVWKSSIEAKALIEYKAQQMEQMFEQQEKAMKDTAAMLKESVEIVADLKNKTIQMNEKFKSLDGYLDTQPKDQKESSEVLKRTIKELSQ